MDRDRERELEIRVWVFEGWEYGKWIWKSGGRCRESI